MKAPAPAPGQPQIDPHEEQELIARYGPAERREVRIELDVVGYAYWLQSIARLRRAEVVLVAQRPDGHVLLHTKVHFPPGTYRFPTGGIQWEEGVLEALVREQWEELGVHLPVVAMPGIVRYQFQYTAWTLPFASYLFLLQAAEDMMPVPQDPGEAISDFCWVAPADLPAVAHQLHQVIHAWAGWGPFRAVPHDLMAEVFRTGEG